MFGVALHSSNYPFSTSIYAEDIIKDFMIAYLDHVVKSGVCVEEILRLV